MVYALYCVHAYVHVYAHQRVEEGDKFAISHPVRSPLSKLQIAHFRSFVAL